VHAPEEVVLTASRSFDGQSFLSVSEDRNISLYVAERWACSPRRPLMHRYLTIRLFLEQKRGPQRNVILSPTRVGQLLIHEMLFCCLGFGKTTLKQAAPILGATWYPSATPTRPEAYCFVTSIRGEPVKLLSATDGRVRNRFPVCAKIDLEDSAQMRSYGHPTK
jgi:hypothetical protein